MMPALLNTLKRIAPRPLKRAVKSALVRVAATSVEIIQPLIHRYCVGSGLEIGAGRFPYCNPRTTVFLDKYTDKDGAKKPDIVSDAKQIPRPDDTFDYVFSSHVLEHMQDTIATLNEWVRVLKPGGILFLVLPHGDRTLDRNRAKTTFEHHISDARTLTDEPDYSHNEEVQIGWTKNSDFEELAKGFEREWGAHIWDFEVQLGRGIIHFHVWTQDEVVRLLQYLEMKIVFVAEVAPERYDSFVVIARKPSEPVEEATTRASRDSAPVTGAA